MTKPATLLLFTFLIAATALPCSMYKVTVGDKTMVGNNEDSWRLTSRIWFEQGREGRYGVAYVGYSDKNGPDGAVNEHGLAFDAFTMPHRPGVPPRDRLKKDFMYDDLVPIMQQCKTVDEVYAYLQPLNLNTLNGSPLFNGGMLLFVDRTGRYLTVECDSMIVGNDDRFVLANFSPAHTKDLGTVQMERYRKGARFIKNKIDTSVAYCTALSDTMSVHRPKAGDGTLYTTIYDLKQGLIHTYFFHDYQNRITFNLRHELAKGDHAYNFADLFPNNAGYQKFVRYKTPQNTPALFAFLVLCEVLFLLSAVYFAVVSVRGALRGNVPKPAFAYLRPPLALLCLCMWYHAFTLTRNQSIFYYPAPYYYEGNFLVTNLTSYLPFVLLVCIVPLLVVNVGIFRKKAWGRFSKWLLAADNVVFLILMGLFWYWGLFSF